MARSESKTDAYWRFSFYGLGAVFLIVFGFVTVQQNGAAFLLLIGSALSLLASRLPDITKFKLTAGGLETELRETIADARATVVQLQRIAGEQARLTLHLMQSEGRWGGGGQAGRAEMRERLFAMLQDIGMTKEQIASIAEVEHPFMHFDYAHNVVRKLTPSEASRAEWNDFYSSEKRKGIGSEPSPSELRAFLANLDMIDQDVEERLQDYEHFHQTLTHRRPDIYARMRG